ncbi:hypothetical protein RND81_11G181700 [Saponaria officinalis]|uniref:Protein root UVB sensitive 6 n=1 Tax=Saponaria officinalis TaxID=3572 RepID=A0AAW1HMR2_SAPOF
MKFRQSQTLTPPSSNDSRLLARETLRISAQLASAPPHEPPPAAVAPPLESKNLRLGFVEEEFIGSSLRLICCEEIDGRRWKYVAENDHGSFKKGSLKSICLQTPQAPIDELVSFIRSYVVPEGFPDSVSPSYVPYMRWRALKDGAGRVGKMLFARQGKKFDYDLKQLRFSGDLLMEIGAGLELATSAVPHLFLPLACFANVAKNVAAVTSTSTRTPIYKAFARGENLGDVTAKGECVGNIADLLGTGFSIMISKRNPSLINTFGLLSCGYLLSSYQEVKSVVLHTLNRARFSVAMDSFLNTGQVPSLKEGNLKEKVFTLPWMEDRPVILGSRFKDAFQDPGLYIALEPLFERERYIVTYNPVKNKVYALLKDQAKTDDILKAAFHGHVLLHSIRSSLKKHAGSENHNKYVNLDTVPTFSDIEGVVAESCKTVSSTYGLFKYKATEQGWMMSESLLNPGRARLCHN